MKKLLFIFLFTLTATSGFGNCVKKYCADKQQSLAKAELLSQSTQANQNQNIVSAKGLLQLSIKINESNTITFQNLKNTKKYFTNNSIFQSYLFSTSGYVYYCARRINTIKISPLYIAHHRLII